ncbi:hypothetical protein F4802DRAFT_578182 [Xylaria palmicola]|nr:hypothetical protein F4802DRAFT_578182 [Xylaria palmicola]
MAQQRRFNPSAGIARASDLLQAVKGFTLPIGWPFHNSRRYRAPQEVFYIPELFDQIMVNLDPWTILLAAQRVSKQWRLYIGRSAYIQRHLWLIGQVDKSCDGTAVEPNPRLVPFMPCFFHFPGLFYFHPISPELLYTKTGLQDETWRSLWVDPSASWRNMQFARPAITRLAWEVWEFNERGNPKVPMPVLKARFNMPGGLTMGHVYDFVLGTAGRHVLQKPQRPDPDSSWPPASKDRDNQGQWEDGSEPIELVIQQQLRHGRVEDWESRGLDGPVPRSLLGGGRALSHFEENLSGVSCLFQTGLDYQFYYHEILINVGRKVAFEFFLAATDHE